MKGQVKQARRLKAGPKGRNLEVGSRRDPRLLVIWDLCFIWKANYPRVYWGSRENLTSVPPLGLFKVRIRELQVNLKLQRANVSLLVKET